MDLKLNEKDAVSGAVVLFVVLAVFSATWSASESSAHFGDTLGGIANVITMLIAGGSLLYAARTVDAARDQHRREVRFEVARAFWTATHMHIQILHAYILSSSKQIRSVGWDEATKTRREFVRHMLDLQFVLPRTAFAPIGSVVSKNFELLVAFEFTDPETPERQDALEKDLAAVRDALFELLEPARELNDFPPLSQSLIPEMERPRAPDTGDDSDASLR